MKGEFYVPYKDIYARYKQDVYIYLVSLTHDPILSEDLVSETFWQLFNPYIILRVILI